MAQGTATQAVTKKQTIPPAIIAVIDAVKPGLPDLLPADIPMEQFRAALWLELTGRPSLHECTPTSLRECIIKAATYGLLPGRDAHFLPFRNTKGGNKLATFVPNYFGLILALERTGKVAKAFAHPVYAGDEFVIDYLADQYKHIPAVALGKPQGTLRFFYGCVRLKDGTTHIEVMDEGQIDAIRRRAPAHDQGPWVDDYLMMARKTALKRVMKYVRLTPGHDGMLEDEDAREHEDIPEERHRQNIVDLFGREPDEDAPITGTKNVTPRSKPRTDEGRDSLAWDTLRSYAADPRLPEAVLERIAAALSPLAPANDTEAHQLADEILSWLDHAETQE